MPLKSTEEVVEGAGRASEGGRRTSVGFTVMIEPATKQQKPRPRQPRTSSKGTFFLNQTLRAVGPPAPPLKEQGGMHCM